MTKNPSYPFELKDEEGRGIAQYIHHEHRLVSPRLDEPRDWPQWRFVSPTHNDPPGDEPSRRRTCKGPRNARKDSKKGTNSVYSTSAQAKKEPNTSDVKEMDASCFQ